MNNKSDKSNYWNNFYRSLDKTNDLEKPSGFAIFCYKYARKNNFNFIVDIACGNGRDSAFFLKNKIMTLSLDRSKEAIKETIKKCHVYEDFIYQTSDIVNEFQNIHFEKKYISQKKIFYLRFFLHTLRDEEINILLNNIPGIFNIQDKLFLEYRTTNDMGRQKVTSDHYRNYIDPNKVIKILERNSMKLEFQKEGTGLAVYKDDDAYVCRQIFGM